MTRLDESDLYQNSLCSYRYHSNIAYTLIHPLPAAETNQNYHIQ